MQEKRKVINKIIDKGLALKLMTETGFPDSQVNWECDNDMMYIYQKAKELNIHEEYLYRMYARVLLYREV